jgi:hypothetical protein
LIVGIPRYAIIPLAWRKKMDRLLSHRWKRLVEIEQIGVDPMEKIARNTTK